MIITKTQAATGGGIVAIGTGGTAAGTILTQGSSQNSENPLDEVVFEIPFTVLALDSDFETSYPSSEPQKVGYSYGWYLVGTYGVNKEGSNNTDNETWWNKSYEKWKTDDKSNLSDEFKDGKIDSGFSSSTSSGDSNKALNKVCKSIYEKDKLSVNFNYDANTDDTSEKLGRDVLKYCSPLGQKPKTISELNEYGKYSSDSSSTYGGSHGGDLISVTTAENKIFWELRNQEFFGKENKNGTGASLANSDISLLYQLYQNRATKQETVRAACEKIYPMKDESNHENRVKKFCSWRLAFS